MSRSASSMSWRITVALIALLLALPLRGASEQRPFPWPDGHRAAVVLAYDDAVASQLDNAIPALDRHRLKGSFFLRLSNETLATRMDEWRAAAARGHELGNHSLFHQCSASLPQREWVEPATDLDSTSKARMQAQVRLANVMLHALDGRQGRTFTVPCGDTQAQDGNYVDALHDDFIAIRLGAGAVVPDMWALDPYAVPGMAPDGTSGRELIARV